MRKDETSNGKKGGLLKGKPHYDENGKPLGGIKAIVTDTNTPVELEGGEVIINKHASRKYWKELSKINQSAGNGVPIKNPNGGDDEDPEEYKEGGRIIDFNPNHLPNKRILTYAKKIKSQYPKVWDLGGNIFGNEAFKNLQRVSERGYWLDSEKWMYIKWRSFVARHTHDFRIKGVIAMLKWVDKVDKGWDYMKNLIEAEIEKKYPSKMEKGGIISWEDFKKSQFDEEENRYLQSGYLGEFEIKNNTIEDYPILIKNINGLEYRKRKNSLILGVFDGDKQVADADNKVVQVAKKYQRKGIGVELVDILKKLNPNHKFGSMTPEGWNLMGSYYDKKIASKMAKGGNLKNNCIDYITKSESILKNGYYFHIKNLNNYIDVGDEIISNIKSLVMITYNSGGQSNLKVIDTINASELSSKIAKLLNCKISIARIIVSEQIKYAKRFSSNVLKSIENENIVIADRDKIVCTNISEKYAKGGQVITYRNKFNKKYGFGLNDSHSLEEVAKISKIKLSSLQDIYNKGIGAYKTNPESVRPNVKSKEQWAMARVYSAIMGGKASKVDANELSEGKMAKGGGVGSIIEAKVKTYNVDDYYLDTAKRFLTKYQYDKWVEQGRSDEQISKEIENAKREIKNVEEKTPYSIWYLELPKGKYAFKIGNSTYDIIKKTQKVSDYGWKSKNWEKTVYEVIKSNDVFSPFDGYILQYLRNVEKKEDIANLLNFYFQNTIQENIDSKYLPKNESKMENGGTFYTRTYNDGTIQKFSVEDYEKNVYPNLEKGGALYLAPNGNESNLTPEQYKLVRTPEFKAWFGDWENDPENASKVVDDNGEPLVVYHGTNKNFTEFKKQYSTKGNKSLYGKLGYYFTNNKSLASDFTKNNWSKSNSLYKKNANILECFLNIKSIKKLTIYQFIQLNSESRLENFKNTIVNEGYEGVVVDMAEEDWEKRMREFDGNQFVAFDSNQIKLADGTNSKFDVDNNDIRYAKGGELAKGIEAEKEHIGIARKLYNKEITPEQSAKAIAQDHLKENPHYYSDLKKTENKAFTCEIIKNGERQIDAKSVAKLTKCINSLPQTKELNSVDGKYTDERIKLHNEIIKEAKTGVTCIQKGKPIAVLMGGSPASGKTTFLKKYRPYLLQNNLFKVDADEVRAKLPEYKGWNASQTHKETGDIVKTLISDRSIGVPCLFDFIYDGTMTGVEKYESLIKFLEKEGYEIYIVFMGNVSKEVVKERALKRYQKSGRFVPMEVLDDFFKTGENTLNQLKTKVDGYIVVDASSPNYEIMEQGGKKLPNKRIYEKLGEPIKLAKGGKVKSKNQLGDCYQSAGNMVMDYKGNNNNEIKFIGTPYLVHAEVSGQGDIEGIRYGHAFIVDDVFVYDYSNNRKIVLPKSIYFKVGKIIEKKPIFYKYTFEEAMKKMREKMNYGPFDLKTTSGL